MPNCVLIISASPHDIAALTNALGNAHDGPFDVESVASLKSGLEWLSHNDADAVLLDLVLPDSQGIDGFDRLHAVCRHAPILTLCELENESDAREAVQRGAQGWLSKGYFDNYLVPQSLRNIIERMKVERRLYVSQARAQITLDSIADAVISADLHGQVDYLNVAAELITGWPRAQANGRPVDEILRIVDEVTGDPLDIPLATALRCAGPTGLNGDAVLLRRDGQRVPIEDSAAPILDWEGKVVGAVMVFRDISKNQQMTAKLRHLAQHDFLTNLPNRLLLNDRIEHAIALASRNASQPALLYLDLDKFKHINDSLGHAMGDHLLQAVSKRLIACVRTSDTVSRHGGDEFIILLAGERRPEDAAAVAEKILRALAQPFDIEGHRLHTSTSIGISVFPLDGSNAALLIKSADTAMYHAKERGRNNYQFFRPEMHTRALERQLVENDLRRALEHAEFVLMYQPKIDLETNHICGVEALLRWQHPVWGLVSPERFLHVAEDCGLIVPIGRWVLRTACEQAVHWRDAGLPAVSIAINVSALEFRHREFLDHALMTFQTSGVDPACLQLELTETVLMRDVIGTANLLASLKASGVQIAVDDFGTGYSSLSYLNQFPIDVLKIDQSFVRAIDAHDVGNGAIVRAVIDMGKNLHQRVVAEGVEDDKQLAFLKTHRCNEAQGFLFSRPLNAAHMQTMLRADRLH